MVAARKGNGNGAARPVPRERAELPYAVRFEPYGEGTSTTPYTVSVGGEVLATARTREDAARVGHALAP